jgi:hypothetical protein
MRHTPVRLTIAVALALFPASAAAQSPPAAGGPFARIAVLRPHEGDTVDFEAGYVRHLEWHREARDTWVWYGWSVTYGERQRWFVYASFGHAAADFDGTVAPAEDERDNVRNVVPHAEFAGNALYEFLPSLSRGTGVPSPVARLELTTVDLLPGAGPAFETALAGQAAPQDETLWYRMAAGGGAPRYVRLRPRPSLAALIEARAEQPLPKAALPIVAKTTIEILSLRPTMSLGLPPPARP